MKKFIGTALVLCCLALPLAGCEDAISTVTSTTMSELEDIPNQILATPESAEMKPEYNYIHLQTCRYGSDSDGGVHSLSYKKDAYPAAKY